MTPRTLDPARPFAEVCPPLRRIFYRQDDRCFGHDRAEVVPDPRDPEGGDYIPAGDLDTALQDVIDARSGGAAIVATSPVAPSIASTGDADDIAAPPATAPAAILDVVDPAPEPSPENPIQEREALQMKMPELRLLSERYNGRTNTKANCIADLITAGVIVPDADDA